MSRTIERGVPIPEPFAQSVSADLRRMKPGDSILFSESVESIRPLVTRIKSEPGSKREFTTRRENGAMRVWRTK